MVLTVRTITFDCRDPQRVASFWAQALDYKPREIPPGFATWSAYLESEGIPNGPWSTSEALSPPDGTGPRLLFLPVPEGKSIKNRVHLDLVPTGSMVDEVERLLRLGARKLAVHDDPFGGFTVMQDPEGNEFCVEAGPDD